MKMILMIQMILLLAVGCDIALGQEPLSSNLPQVGGYGDDARAVTCVSGTAGASFEHVVWAWMPGDLGLAYLTLRFDFPANLDLTSYPVFNDLVMDVIYTDYPGGTVEWNMIFGGCPSGWVKVFSQECVLLDGELSRIGIQAAHSMLRDCNFVLNDVYVLNELVVNDPDCPTVQGTATVWGEVKSLYR